MKVRLFFGSLLLLFASVLQLYWFQSIPGVWDIEYWIGEKILGNTVKYGLIEGYARADDLIPPLFYPLHYLTHVIANTTGWPLLLAYKANLSLFTFFASMAFLLFTNSIGLSFLLLISISVNSVMLSMPDSYSAPMVVVAVVLFLRNHYLASILVMSIGLFVKWQCLLLLPILITAYACRDLSSHWAKFHSDSVLRWATHSMRALVDSKVFSRMALALGLFAIVTLANYAVWSEALLKAFLQGQSHQAYYAFLGPWSMNFGWLWQYVLRIKDPGLYGELPPSGFIESWHYFVRGGASSATMKLTFIFKIIATLVYASVCARILFLKNRRIALGDALMCAMLTYYVWGFGVHINHYYNVVIAGAFSFYLTRRWSRFVIPALLFNLNLIIIYGGAQFNVPRMWFGIDAMSLLAVANILFYIVLMYQFFWQPIDLAPTSAMRWLAKLKDTKNTLLKETL